MPVPVPEGPMPSRIPSDHDHVVSENDYEPNNSDSANQAASLRMQREKMLRSTLGDERYRIIEAIGAKDELIHSLFPVLTE